MHWLIATLTSCQARSLILVVLYDPVETKSITKHSYALKFCQGYWHAQEPHGDPFTLQAHNKIYYEQMFKHAIQIQIYGFQATPTRNDPVMSLKNSK
jgi:hypothetical protein